MCERGGVIGLCCLKGEVFSRQKFSRVYMQGRGYQARYVHLCILAKQNSVGVDEPHMTIARKGAQDIGRIIASDAVEHVALRCGLSEVGGFASTDRKLGPVDRGFLLLCLDGKGVAIIGLDDC